MREYGERLGSGLPAGAVVALYGDLGAGKTTLAQAIACGLGVKEPVTSPTFTLIHEYGGGRLPLYHFDVYRLSDASEMDELGYEEYFYGDGVCVVEWADRVEGLLPDGAVRIALAYTDDEGAREVEES
ncbi:MAG: tRNA (adenosine(37)-N6)-threonylcarbamoyltransferase complex ATPase subunit type 1 TsaE [Clostridiales Family XIII bacterium]|nr:tRNA (adenosine(37)-N6)-threonylcarbamoyltransferase complex ATPase subunit type 1 TsaE [Clostridiales Family XIII bacterium]